MTSVAKMSTTCILVATGNLRKRPCGHPWVAGK